MKNIAVVLCGSGFKDGSEIRESVAVLWAISLFGAEAHCFSPDGPQKDVVNCLTGHTMPETRDMRVEAARIARGEVAPLDTLNSKEFSAIILPGGFGAAKNLCDFATRGAQASVNKDLERVLKDFHHAKKPIGAVCIAPVIVALALKGIPLELTLGETSDASRAIETLGHRHVQTPVDACHVDSKNRVVSTAAYMYADAKLSPLFEGIRKLVGAVLEMGQ